MTSISLPVPVETHPNLRPLNVLRDLSVVADLIELCFSNTMDNEGQRYVSDMRRASRDDGFLRWAMQMAESTSLPLTGYVWEENNKIVGNASLVPFRYKRQLVYLIANVAVHPDYRRRGIARALTERAMFHGRDKKAHALWLHVREDNPGAVNLYEELGFQERARRTTWQAEPDAFATKPQTDIAILKRESHYWPRQQEWMNRLYPEALAWYRAWNFTALRPGLWNWLYLLFVDMNIRQWAAVRGDQLHAALALIPSMGRVESLWAATGPTSDPAALTVLLIHARRTLAPHRTLTLDYPAGESGEAIMAAGFRRQRTLIWMETHGATS